MELPSELKRISWGYIEHSSSLWLEDKGVELAGPRDQI